MRKLLICRTKNPPSQRITSTTAKMRNMSTLFLQSDLRLATSTLDKRPSGWEALPGGKQWLACEQQCQLATARDRRNEHNLIAILEGVSLSAEEANVLVVDVDIDEAAELTFFIF